jgi:small subunit ribosomal protein S17
METAKQIIRKTLSGTVISTKMKDSAVVSVSRFVKHPKYKKYLKRSKNYTAHDPGNTVKEGDRVLIRSCRPISKTKHFEIVTK